MRIDKITRKVYIEIEGKEYGLRLTLSGLQQLENTMGNLLLALQTQTIPKVTNMATAFWIGLGGAKKYSRSEADGLFEKYIQEHGIGGEGDGAEGAVAVFYAMIALNGIMGKTASRELLERFGLDGGGEGISEKNAETATAE